MSKSLTIWVFQTGEPLHIDAGNPRPMRAMNLANALVADGHKVISRSSACCRMGKRHRNYAAVELTGGMHSPCWSALVDEKSAHNELIKAHP